MKSVDDLVVQHKCSDCTFRGPHFFCSFPDTARTLFEALKVTSTYKKGNTLFVQGQPSNGVYMLCNGRVKLSTYSQDGRAIIVRVAEAGEMLGLSSVISDIAHLSTAEAIESCQINFIWRDDFLRFLRQEPQAGINALRQLSHNYHTVHAKVCSLGLSSTVGDKLAKLLLSWCANGNGNGNGNGTSPNGGAHMKMDFSHEEIAEMIGSSRETVTRLLKDFRTRDLISLKGSDLYIHDKKRLEGVIGRHVTARPAS